MAPPEKYLDFIKESEYTRTIHEKNGTPVDVMYSVFRCPHCRESLTLPTHQVKAKKSDRCLKHLKVCEKYDYKKERPSKDSDADGLKAEIELLKEKLDRQTELITQQNTKMNAQHAEIMSRLSNMCELAPPPPKDEVELVERLKTTGTSGLKRKMAILAKNDKIKKRLRYALHTDNFPDPEQAKIARTFYDMFGL